MSFARSCLIAPLCQMKALLPQAGEGQGRETLELRFNPENPNTLFVHILAGVAREDLSPTLHWAIH